MFAWVGSVHMNTGGRWERLPEELKWQTSVGWPGSPLQAQQCSYWLSHLHAQVPVLNYQHNMPRCWGKLQFKTSMMWPPDINTSPDKASRLESISPFCLSPCQPTAQAAPPRQHGPGSTIWGVGAAVSHCSSLYFQSYPRAAWLLL